MRCRGRGPHPLVGSKAWRCTDLGPIVDMLSGVAVPSTHTSLGPFSRLLCLLEMVCFWVFVQSSSWYILPPMFTPDRIRPSCSSLYHASALPRCVPRDVRVLFFLVLRFVRAD